MIVHDGDDSSAQAIRQRYPGIKFVKGRGCGATAAAALGVETATGDFILFLHSDDRLCPGALPRLVVEASRRPEVMIWTGGLRIFRTLPEGDELSVRWFVDRELTRLTLENVCDVLPLLTARFCHRSIFGRIGNFDPQFSECSDREFLLRAAISKLPEESLGTMVSEVRQHEGSRTIPLRHTQVPLYLAEHLKIADMWSVRPDVDQHVRRFLRNWRARETLRLLVHQCRAGQWKEAGARFLSAGRADLSWIVRSLTLLRVQHLRRGQPHPDA
jgi:hypothetical protein